MLVETVDCCNKQMKILALPFISTTWARYKNFLSSFIFHCISGKGKKISLLFVPYFYLQGSKLVAFSFERLQCFVFYCHSWEIVPLDQSIEFKPAYLHWWLDSSFILFKRSWIFFYFSRSNLWTQTNLKTDISELTQVKNDLL